MWHMWKKINAYRIVIGKPEGTLGSRRSRWVNNVQKNIIAIRLISLDWINSPIIWTSGWLFWTRYWTLGFHNHYWQAEELLASHERSCSIELRTRYDPTAHVWCVSTHVWCAVVARLSSCEFATTSDPCSTLHGCSRPGFSAGGRPRNCKAMLYLFQKHLLYSVSFIGSFCCPEDVWKRAVLCFCQERALEPRSRN
jgi:hypothetical protein